MIHAWPLVLDELLESALPPATSGERARAAKLRDAGQAAAYLRSRRALCAILRRHTSARLTFAVTEKGKPYLPGDRELRFNLSRSGGMMLIAMARGIEVGADIERIRPLNDYAEIAERYFPASEAAGLREVPLDQREREFFRRWTRIEAVLKARGVGLYGLGVEIDDNWTIAEIPVSPGYAAAVAAPGRGLPIQVHRFEE